VRSRAIGDVVVKALVHVRGLGTGVATLCFALLANTAHAVKVGDRAPALNLPTAAGANTVAFDKSSGKVFYVDFWASWCGPCKQSFPWMSEMHEKYASRGLEIVAINVDTRRADADRFLSPSPVKFTVAFDPKGDTPKQYAVPSMPSSYLVDNSGKVIAVHSGFRDSDRAKLEAAIVDALAQAKK
jgi:cytochrome c biogenesis protein CcmG, thiol:disulfide interchange protein DsbE